MFFLWVTSSTAKFQKFQNGFRGDGDEKEEEDDEDDDEDDDEEDGDELPPPPSLNHKDKKNKPMVGSTKDSANGKTTKVGCSRWSQTLRNDMMPCT